MKPFPIEELVDRCGSHFAVVVAAGKRAKQIKEGAPPLISLPTRNPLTIALHEIAAGLVEITEEPVILIEEPLAASPEETISELPSPEAVAELLGLSIVDDLSDLHEDEPDQDEDIAEDLAEDLDEDLDDEDDDETDDDEGEELELDEDDDWDAGEE